MRAIDKRFQGVQALAAASLELNPGETMGLIGQNGAGKSTLIKVLTGANRRDSGTIQFDGREIDFASPQAAQTGGISTIYQEINLIPQRSVAENVMLGREFKRFGFLDWRRINQEAVRLLRRFNIDIDVTQPLSDYSTAIQQMTAIARAVSFKSKLVIMDEPTSSLDEREVAVLFDVIRQLRAEGVAVIFVSHKLDELYRVCDRVTIMRDGRTVRVSPMSEIDKVSLVQAMIGRELASTQGRSTGFTESKAGTGEEVLGVEGLKSGFRVKDARVRVRAGEIVGLAGLLGSGRTEVARAVFGADVADSGEVRLAGSNGAPKDPSEAIARGVGFCSEDRKLDGIVPHMSVAENLTLAVLPKLTKLGIVDEAARRRIVETFIKRLGIRTSGPDQKIRELSGGNQQKVLLARWLCADPKLLLLDEPTRGIDVGAKAEIQGLIRELADKGLGVLMISSELDELVEGGDRTFVLSDGRTVAELTREQATPAALIAAMAHVEPQGEAEGAAHV